MKKSNTRRSLLLSALSLLMCVSMLIGSTFAWFTDEVKSGVNKIEAGNLDIELYHGKVAAPDKTTGEEVEGATNIFTDKDGKAIAWEPGVVAWTNLNVVNEGSLALKYQLAMNFTDENYIKGTNAKLSEVLKVAFLDEAVTGTREQILAAAKALPGVKLADLMKAGDLAKGTNKIYGVVIYWEPSAEDNRWNVQNGAETSDGKPLHISLGITLVATQKDAEFDSFGSDYDKNANYPAVRTEVAEGGDTIVAGEVAITLPAGAGEAEYTVNVENKVVTTNATGDTTVSFNIELLKNGVKVAPQAGVTYPVSIYIGENLNVTEVTHKGAAVANWSYDSVSGVVSFETDSFSPFAVAYFSGLVETAADIEALIAKGADLIVLDKDVTTENGFVIDKDVVIDLNGKTITGTMHKNVGAVIKNTAKLVLKNGTVSSTANNGGSALMNNGTAVLENVTLNGAPNADGSWPSYTVNNTGVMEATNTKFTSYHGAVASYNEGALVTLNNCEIDMTGIPGFTSHGIYVYNSGAVVVNGGTYANKATDQGASGASVINGAVTVNAGTFSGRIESYYGTPVIKGGTFTVKPQARFIAAGYMAIENNGAYIVVPENVDKVVCTAADLLALSAKNFTANNGVAETYTIMLGADIDMKGATFSAMIAQRGDTLNFLGNGYTISNVNIVSGADDNTTGQASMFYCYPNSTLNISDLTLKDIKVAAEENASGYAAAVIGYCEGAAKLTDVDVVNATVIGAKSSGMLAGHLGNGGTLTATGCDVSGTVTLTDYENGGHYAGKLIGTVAGNVKLTEVTCNVTVGGNLHEKNVGDTYGRFVSGDMTVVTVAEDGLCYATNPKAPGEKALYDIPADYAEENMTVPGDVTALGNSVFGYTNVKEVTIPATVTDFGASGVSNTNASGGAFKNSNVEKVVLTEGMTEIPAAAFNGATKLTEVNIPASVEKIGVNAFRSTAITELVIPATVKEVAYGAFRDMTSLTTVTFEGDSLTLPGYAFRGCTNLRTVYLKCNTLTLNGGMNFANASSNNPGTNNITFYVENETVAAAVKAHMGVGSYVAIYVGDTLYAEIK